jgi:hypothetical protein
VHNLLKLILEVEIQRTFIKEWVKSHSLVYSYLTKGLKHYYKTNLNTEIISLKKEETRLPII